MTARLTAAARDHEHVAAGLLLALVATAWLWPLLLGRQIGQASTLYGQYPWAAAHPAARLPPRAIAPDVAQEGYPWMVVARDALRHGRLPSSGTPTSTAA